MSGILAVICSSCLQPFGLHPPVLLRGTSFVYSSRHLYISHCSEIKCSEAIVNAST